MKNEFRSSIEYKLLNLELVFEEAKNEKKKNVWVLKLGNSWINFNIPKNQDHSEKNVQFDQPVVVRRQSRNRFRGLTLPGEIDFSRSHDIGVLFLKS